MERHGFCDCIAAFRHRLLAGGLLSSLLPDSHRAPLWPDRFRKSHPLKPLSQLADMLHSTTERNLPLAFVAYADATLAPFVCSGFCCRPLAVYRCVVRQPLRSIRRNADNIHWLVGDVQGALGLQLSLSPLACLCEMKEDRRVVEHGISYE